MAYMSSLYRPLLGYCNFLLITFDSCRWDTFATARTPSLDRHCRTRCAYTQGTFTLPAHMAMYQGILPQIREHIPFYNRNVGQLIRIADRSTNIPNLITFERGCENIIEGFSRAGYRTFGTGAVGWFHHPQLARPFQKFLFTGIHAARQVECIMSWIGHKDQPFFGFVNFGETHEPYECTGNVVSQPSVSRPRQVLDPLAQWDREAWGKQVRCCEYLDGLTGELLFYLEMLSSPTIVILCGDHGECFGEDGWVGHGFYHPKVMEVPIAIFEINGGHLTSWFEPFEVPRV